MSGGEGWGKRPRDRDPAEGRQGGRIAVLASLLILGGSFAQLEHFILLPLVSFRVCMAGSWVATAQGLNSHPIRCGEAHRPGQDSGKRHIAGLADAR